MSGGMAWPAVGVVGGGEASAASQPAMGGRSMRHDRLLWAAGARRPEVEEALRPLDGHRTVTAARIVYID